MIKYTILYPEKKLALMKFFFDKKYKILEKFLDGLSVREAEKIMENCKKAIQKEEKNQEIVFNYGNMKFKNKKTHIDLIDNEYYGEAWWDDSEPEITGSIDISTKELMEITKEWKSRKKEENKIKEIYENTEIYFDSYFNTLPGFLCSEIKLRDKEKNLKLFSEILNGNEIKKMCGKNFEAEIGTKITKLKCLKDIKHEAYYNDTAVIETKKLFEYIKEYYKLVEAKAVFYKETGKEPDDIEKMWFY